MSLLRELRQFVHMSFFFLHRACYIGLAEPSNATNNGFEFNGLIRIRHILPGPAADISASLFSFLLAGIKHAPLYILAMQR